MAVYFGSDILLQLLFISFCSFVEQLLIKSTTFFETNKRYIKILFQFLSNHQNHCNRPFRSFYLLKEFHFFFNRKFILIIIINGKSIPWKQIKKIAECFINFIRNSIVMGFMVIRFAQICNLTTG